MTKQADSNLSMRVEPDQWVKMLPNLNLITWCLGIISIGIALFTMPWFKSFLNVAFKANLRPRLDSQILEIDFYLTIVAFLICLMGIIIQSKRSRRRGDKRYSSFMLF